VLCPPAAVVLGARTLRRIPRSGEGGGVALFGTALGALSTPVLAVRDRPGAR
jgi:hypothetical protein